MKVDEIVVSWIRNVTTTFLLWKVTVSYPIRPLYKQKTPVQVKCCYEIARSESIWDAK